MTELRALARREWIIVRRWLLALAALTFAGYAALYVLCRPADRYRLLCDTALLRRVALPSALAAGAALAYRSFAYEVRARTWDNLLLLPVRRGRVIAVKVAVATCALAAITVLPMLALWARVASSPATGGPLLTVGQLFVHSILAHAALVGVTSYCAGAAAALGLRADARLFWTPLTLAAVLFVATSGDHPEQIRGRAVAVVLFAAALSLWRVAREANESASKPSALLVTLRAAGHVPLLLVASLFALEFARDFLRQRRPTEHVVHSDSRSFGVDDRGRIGWSHRTLAMRRLEDRTTRDAFESRRLWQPRYVDHTQQYFVDPQRNVLLGYHTHSGEPIGCVGSSGFRVRDCRPFSSTPSFVGQDPALLVGSHFIAAFRGADSALESLFTGPVGRVAQEVDDARLTFQSGDDLMAIAVDAPPATTSSDDPSDGMSEDDAIDPPAGPSGAEHEHLRVVPLCRDVGRFGSINEYAIEEGFVAVMLWRSREHRETFAVCRNGVVTASESRTRVERAEVPPRPLRDYVTFAVLGPIVSSARTIERHYAIGGEIQLDRPVDPRPAWLVAAIAALVTLAIGARRRAIEGSAAIATLLIGPVFLLAWVITRARGPRR